MRKWYDWFFRFQNEVILWLELPHSLAVSSEWKNIGKSLKWLGCLVIFHSCPACTDTFHIPKGKVNSKNDWSAQATWSKELGESSTPNYNGQECPNYHTSTAATLSMSCSCSWWGGRGRGILTQSPLWSCPRSGLSNQTRDCQTHLRVEYRQNMNNLADIMKRE